ncbi:MAG: lipopolysaccharide biosynthesis protein [Acidobacteriaceae bacterium]|nr:lipopolysaccharide biosynthesis protein [Acidobacteriaceae bacterium]
MKPAELIAEPEFVRYEPDEITLFMLFHMLSRRKRALLRNTLIAAAASVPIVLLLPVKFTAEAVILTPQQPQPSLAAMAQLSGAAAGNLSGLSLLSGFGLRNPSDMYIGILKSRTVADSLIHTFHLQQVYGRKYILDTRKQLARRTSIETAKDSLIHVRVEDRDPNRAADLANAYVDELSKQNSRFTLTEASQRRRFFEEELLKEKDQLASAEIALRNTQQATGLVAPMGQAEALIRSGAQLRVEIVTRQAELEAMKTYASDENPRLQIVKRELSALQGELARVEHGNNASGTLDLATGQLPQAGLEYTRKLRDVKYHETLFEILAKQYEAARLDEAKSAPLVEVVDRAIAPEKKSWPPRAILVLSTMAFAAIGTSFWIVFAYRRDARPR